MSAAARSAGAAWQRLTLSDRAASAGAVSRLSGDVDIADFASRVVQGAAERRVCRSGLIAAICPMRIYASGFSQASARASRGSAAAEGCPQG